MKRMVQVTTVVALCFAYASWWSPAAPQQPTSPELVRPAVCDQLNIDGRASTPLRPAVALPRRGCAFEPSPPPKARSPIIFSAHPIPPRAIGRRLLAGSLAAP